MQMAKVAFEFEFDSKIESYCPIFLDRWELFQFILKNVENDFNIVRSSLQWNMNQTMVKHSFRASVHIYIFVGQEIFPKKYANT